MPRKSLITHRTPDTFLMKSVQLMFIVHVMIFASDVAKSCFTNVTLINRLSMGHRQMVTEAVRPRKDILANVAFVGGHGGRGADIPMQFEMFFEFQTFVESLPTNFADWRDFTRVFAHMVQKVLLFAENVATDVTFVLNFAGMNRYVFLQAIQPGKFTLANGTHKESGIVLNCVLSVIDLGNGFCNGKVF